MSPVLMMLSRDVRRVPMDYEPPRTDRGHAQPVFEKFYAVALREWEDAKRHWDAGERPDYCSPENLNLTYEEWDGPAPDPADYYPGESWPADAVLGIRMYESVTEGTSISATYPDTAQGKLDMAAELATNRDTGITSGLTEADWLDVIESKVQALDIHTGALR